MEEGSNMVRVWDVDTGNCVATVKSHHPIVEKFLVVSGVVMFITRTRAQSSQRVAEFFHQVGRNFVLS